MRLKMVGFLLMLTLLLTACGARNDNMTGQGDGTVPSPASGTESGGFIGYVVEKDGDRILVVSPEAKDFSATGGLPRFHAAIWFKDSPPDIEVGMKVEAWAVGGAVMESYPSQGTAERVSILTDIQPEEAKLTAAEAVGNAILSNKTEGSPFAVITGVEYEASASVWIVHMLNDARDAEIEIEVPDSMNQPTACSNAIIDYIDAIRWNGLNYHNLEDSGHTVPSITKGKELGEIGFTLANSACLGYKMKNGDATYLPKGTKVYEAKDYTSSFRLIAGDRVYQVNDNPDAKTIADVYDIKGKVTKISFESTEDGSHISDFSEEATVAFTEQYLALEYFGFDELYKKGFDDSVKSFLRIHLKDGTSYRIVYWMGDNLISPGAAGTERLLDIVEAEQGITD